MYEIPILKPPVATSICDSHEISNTYIKPRTQHVNFKITICPSRKSGVDGAENWKLAVL